LLVDLNEDGGDKTEEEGLVGEDAYFAVISASSAACTKECTAWRTKSSSRSKSSLIATAFALS
jgi:hypothetical protein